MNESLDGISPGNCAWADFVLPGQTVAAWFSCGAASAVATKRLIDRVGHKANIRIMNTFIEEEHSDNRRFLADCEDWFGRKIESVVPRAYPVPSIRQVFEDKRVMSFANGYAPCTVELKRVARQEWECTNNFDWLVLGFTYEEEGRYLRFQKSERSNILPVLTSAKLTKAGCWQILIGAGIGLPEMYNLGFNNANCIGCVKATSPTYWNLTRRYFPHHFKSRAEQSRALGVRLARVKGERVFLDELPLDAVGAPIASVESECGVFCEERQISIFEELH